MRNFFKYATMLLLMVTVANSCSKEDKKDLKENDNTTDIVIYPVEISDAKFKAYLIDEKIDKNSDGYITKEEAQNVTEINVENKGIQNFNGIHAFFNLEKLNCNQNQLQELNIGNNTKLLYVDCNNTQLTNLDVSKNTQLQELYCSSNSQLRRVNLETNTQLEYLDCSFNPLLGKLNLKKNTELKQLYCSSNSQLQGLNLENNTKLKELHCNFNPQLTRLNLEKNIELQQLYCNNNQNLTKLNLKNGKNSLLTKINTTNNPNLKCIQVDNPIEAKQYRGWKVDNTDMYTSTPCL